MYLNPASLPCAASMSPRCHAPIAGALKDGVRMPGPLFRARCAANLGPGAAASTSAAFATFPWWIRASWWIRCTPAPRINRRTRINHDNRPRAGRDPGRRGRAGRGGGRGRGVVRRQRAGAQPALPARPRARPSTRNGTGGPLDPAGRDGGGLGGLQVPDLGAGRYRTVCLLQLDHLGALDAARAGHGPGLPRRGRGLGCDHGGPGRWRDHGRAAVPGPAAAAAHGDRHGGHVLLRAARYPDGPARRGPLGGCGRLRLRRGVGDLRHLRRHRPAAADTAGAAGSGQLALDVPGLWHRRHRARDRRAACRRGRARGGLRGGGRLWAAEQRGHAGHPVRPCRPLARPGAGRGCGRVTASWPRPAGPRRRPAARPR